VDPWNSHPYVKEKLLLDIANVKASSAVYACSSAHELLEEDIISEGDVDD
jgi:hypothetical protein